MGIGMLYIYPDDCPPDVGAKIVPSVPKTVPEKLPTRGSPYV